MFCRKCGKEIADNSQFCQYCGAKLAENANSTSFVNRVFSAIEKTKLSDKAKNILACYLIWVIINAACLIFYRKYRDAADWLFPFASSDLRIYDWTDFIFYILLVPCALYCIKVIYNRRMKS